ncbi:MAG: hypothetical protein R3199_09585 [Gemmatimonadota bacterium]|nr:hypothetical protein [Gemmatimonadota bacterium]
MTEDTRPVEPSEDEEEPEFVGTLFVVMVFIILTAGMWAAVYFMLLGR